LGRLCISGGHQSVSGEKGSKRTRQKNPPKPRLYLLLESSEPEGRKERTREATRGTQQKTGGKYWPEQEQGGAARGGGGALTSGGSRRARKARAARKNRQEKGGVTRRNIRGGKEKELRLL